jgi:hypothetical protein
MIYLKFVITLHAVKNKAIHKANPSNETAIDAYTEISIEERPIASIKNMEVRKFDCNKPFVSWKYL